MPKHSDPTPCSTCGTCPTCGRNASPPVVLPQPIYPQPYYPWAQGPYWYGTGTGTRQINTTGIQVSNTGSPTITGNTFGPPTTT